MSDRWHLGNLSSARVRALLMSAHCVSGALCVVLADLQSGGRRRLWAACPTPHPALCAAPPPCRPAAGKPKGRGQEMCVRVVPQLLYEHEPAAGSIAAHELPTGGSVTGPLESPFTAPPMDNSAADGTQAVLSRVPTAWVFHGWLQHPPDKVAPQHLNHCPNRSFAAVVAVGLSCPSAQPATDKQTLFCMPHGPLKSAITNRRFQNS